MEWKQPEGLRRHWVLEEADAELLFVPTPLNAAQGRVGEDVFDLRDGGLLRKKRTLAVDGVVLATLEQNAAGAGGVLRNGERQFVWRSRHLLSTRWVLEDAEGKVVFAYRFKQGLGKVATVETGDSATEAEGPLLLLCWYATVL